MSIQIKGLDKLQRRYGRFRFMEVLEPAVRRGAMRNQRGMADYPPKPAGSSYIRTGTLGRRWTTKVYTTGSALYGVTGNNAHYAPRVQSKERQLRVFKRIGWPTDEGVLEKNAKDIQRDIQKTVTEALKR